MGKSGYLDRIRAQRLEAMAVAERCMRQYMMDTMQLTLHDELGFGYDRIRKFTEAWAEIYEQFREAVTGGPEQDYCQAKMDALMAEIIRDKQDLIPFEARYPEVRTR